MLELSLLLGSGVAGCACGLCCGSSKAVAKTKLVPPPQAKLEAFDLPRDKAYDLNFAKDMASANGNPDSADVDDRKKLLFRRLLPSLPRGATVVELGIGAFPNAVFLRSELAPTGMDIVGVDPNDSIEEFARSYAQQVGLLDARLKNSLRIVHGVAEALPLETGTADAVISTNTLCSVLDPARAVAEIKRVLKPNGKFLFFEHVLSETNPELAASQKVYKGAGGCHFDRRSLQTIQAAGFSSVDAQYFEFSDYWLLNPNVEGIAVA